MEVGSFSDISASTRFKDAKDSKEYVPFVQRSSTKEYYDPADEDKSPSILAPVDLNNTVYWIYVLYGFSVLAIFNSILSTLDYFINSMPDYSPEFVVDLGLNIFVTISAVFVIVYGHLLSFEVKNNLCIIF